jgi:hypothetical protein
VPVVSSSNQYTVPLDIAQQMKPRPPSVLMYKQNNTDKKLYSLPPLVQTEELDETLLWMEHPYTSENQPQSLVIKSYSSSFNGPEKVEAGSLCEQAVPQTSGYTDLLSTGQWYDDRLLEWVNLHLEYNIENLSQSFCSGEILLEILESVSGQVVNYTTKNPVKSMDMLDNIVVAFKFMSQLGIEENGYAIKGNIFSIAYIFCYCLLNNQLFIIISSLDIFSGNKGNIINMLVAIKDWSEALK